MSAIQMIGAFEELGWPGRSIHDVRGQLPSSERESVARYLGGGVSVSAVPGFRNDVIDGELLTVTSSLHTDGRYIWEGDLVHYVRKYGVGLPADFLDQVARGAPPDSLDAEADRAVTEWLRAHFGGE